jgi:hypothetical protein
MSTVVKPCTCKDEFQDTTYGKGLRLHNVGSKTKDKVAYCTCCSPSQFRTLRHFPPDFPAPVFGCHPYAWGALKNGKPNKPDRGAKSLR